MTTYIGVDIGKEYFDVAIAQTNDVKRFLNDELGYKALIQWMPNQNCAIVMEATGKYSLGLALVLYEQKISVSVVNPTRIKRYAQSQLNRTKTDKEDAKLIADFAMTQRPKPWQPPSPTLRKLQEWHRVQSLLIKQEIQLKNQMGSSLELEIQEFEQEQIAHLSQQLKKIETKIKKCLRSDDELLSQVKLLETIPGIAEATATRLLVGIRDIKYFDKAKHMASFMGLAPLIRQSGSSLNSSKMSKMGDAELRKALYMPALSAIQHNPVIKRFSERLKANGVKGKKRVVAIMRKLIHIVFAVLKHGKPFDPEYKNCA
ncbi:IS110 family transposase [Thiomicrorhabdus hydrogeniphila]